jgi:hypothetical protein
MGGARVASNGMLPYIVWCTMNYSLPYIGEALVRLTTFLLADHAEAVSGKLYVTGGCWNSITAAQLPVEHPHFTVAASLHVPWQATNQQHSLRLDLIDANGQSILPEAVQGIFEVGRAAGMRSGDESVIVFAFNFDRMVFHHAGAHEFVLEVDGTELERIGFKVLIAAPVPMTGQAKE